MADSDETGGGSSGKSIACYAILADPVLVPQNYGEIDFRTLDHQQQGASLTRDHRQASSFAKAETFGMPMYRDLWSTPMSATVEDLLGKSRRPGTRTKYGSVQKKWVRYCKEKGYHCMEADTTIFLNFIDDEFDRGMKYSTIRGYISALQPFMKNVDLVIVSKVMKWVFNTRPPKAKYTCIWDVDVLLRHLEGLATTSDMHVSRKLACLFMVLSGNRVNMLSLVKITNMYITDDECTFVFDNVLKQSRPNFNDSPITFRTFSQNMALCPVRTLRVYLEMRLTRTADEELFITTTQPYRNVSPDIFARWIKDTKGEAGINTGHFSAHSCRAAFTTSASLKGVSLTTIIKSASWSGDSTYDICRENLGLELLKQFELASK